MGRYINRMGVWLTLTILGITLANAQQVEKEKLEKHVYVLASDSLQGRKAGSEGSRKAAQYIIEEFQAIGIEPMFDSTYLQAFVPESIIGPSGISCNNIVGIIRSSDPKYSNEYIVVGAHYDHLGTKERAGKTIIYNGADDNASGVATVIEAARNLVSLQDQLKRSIIIVAFDAEEIGLIGSTYFIKNPPVPEHSIKLMISIDMVGWLKQSGKLSYQGTGTIKDGKRILTIEAKRPGDLNVIVKKFEKSLFTATDTEPFAVKGIPTLAVTTGTKSPYHQPEDTAEKIDYDGLVAITGHVSDAVRIFSSSDQFSASGKVAGKHRNSANKVEFGVSLLAGTNFLRYSSGPYKGRNAFAGAAGVFTQFNFNFIGIRPEVLYERTGTIYPDGKIWRNSVIIPLNIVLQTPKTSSGGAYISTGGYYRHTIDAEIGGEKMSFKTFYRGEGGMQFGIGFWISKVTIGATMRYGLSDMLKEKEAGQPNIRSRSSQVNISYTF